MCGIAGIMSFGPPLEEQDLDILHRMTDRLAHRGPDDRGVWSNSHVGLGHRRLSVIDLSAAGHQPMANEDGSVLISYNGEVYNFRELAARFRLAERGHVFRSRTDTEVLVHLFEELGPDMARELNGIFAIAIWDGRERVLHLMRDGYGTKPLFYQRDADRFRFGSEIKALLADARVPRAPSLQALHDFLSFAYVPGEQTAFEGIFEVPPGHRMTVTERGATEPIRYWDLPCAVDESIDEATAVTHAGRLMEESVERQLVADVPVGVLLSGGMDSSALVALMSRTHREPIHTYSVGFEDTSFNELPYARAVAREFGTVQREVVVTPQLVRELLPKYLTFIDEPYGDGSAIPTYYVCELAKDDVVVVLSGEGGDEAFAGYETYAAFKVSRWFRRVPAVVRNRLLAPLIECLPVSHRKLSLEFKLKRFIRGQDLEPAQAHLWWRIVLTEAEKLQLYTPDVAERLVPRPSEAHFVGAFERCGARDALARLLYIDASVFLPDDLMIKNDRMSMAHSIEARVPFTDLELVNYMATVPPRLKLKGLRKKHIMRRALAGRLPDRILQKKKVGLEMPYSRWLRGELRDLVSSYLGAESLSDMGLFRPEAVQRLVAEHEDGRRDHGRALWGLLNYAMWYRLHF